MNAFEAIDKVNKLKSKIETLIKVIENMAIDQGYYSGEDIDNLKEDKEIYTKELKELEERMKATKIESFTTFGNSDSIGHPTTY